MATLKQLKNKRTIKKKEFMEEWKRAMTISNQLEPLELVAYRRRLVKWWKNENLKCFLTSSERKSMWKELTSLTYVSSPEINKLYKKEAAAHKKRMEKAIKSRAALKAKVRQLMKKNSKKMSEKEIGLYAAIITALSTLAANMKLAWEGTKNLFKKHGRKIGPGLLFLGVGFDYYRSGELGLKGIDRFFYMTMALIDEFLIVGGRMLASAGAASMQASATATASAGAVFLAKLLTAIGVLIGGYRLYTGLTGKPDYLDELAQIYINFSDPEMLKKKRYENKCLPKASYEGSDGKLTKNIFIDQAYRLHQSKERLVSLNNETLNLIKEIKKKKKQIRAKATSGFKKFMKGKEETMEDLEAMKKFLKKE